MLETIRAKGTLVTARLPGGVFQSLVRSADPGRRELVLERAPNEGVNAALLAQARCTFSAGIPGFRIEFVVTGPRAETRDGRPLIVLDLPEVLVTHQQRAHPRVDVTPPVQLQCLADAGGITPFDAKVVDIGAGGLAFLLYPGGINLEPGTVLQGCRIELPDGGFCVTDLEVRYTQTVAQPDGTPAARSGCRFVNPGPEVAELVRRYVKA